MAVSRLIHCRQQRTSFYLAALVGPDNRKTTIRLVCVFHGNKCGYGLQIGIPDCQHAIIGFKIAEGALILGIWLIAEDDFPSIIGKKAV